MSPNEIDQDIDDELLLQHRAGRLGPAVQPHARHAGTPSEPSSVRSRCRPIWYEPHVGQRSGMPFACRKTAVPKVASACCVPSSARTASTFVAADAWVSQLTRSQPDLASAFMQQR